MNNPLSKRDSNVIWHPYTQHQKMEEPVPIVKGEGALLFDENGNTYLMPSAAGGSICMVMHILI